MELKQQEGESLANYEANFFRISRYAPQFIANIQSKMERFRHGLKPLIKRALAPISFQTFEALVRGAREFEKENTNFVESRNRSEKRKQGGQKMGGQHQDHKRGRYPMCQRCGKMHTGQCLYGAGKCFKCGGPGHIAKDCVGQSGSSMGGKPITSTSQGEQLGVRCYNCQEFGHYANNCPKPRKSIQRSYKEEPRLNATTVEEEEPAGDTVKGMVTVCSLWAHTLFDTGATHSFVSYKFSHMLDIPYNKLSQQLSVKIASGSVVPTSIIYKSLPVKINE